MLQNWTETVFKLVFTAAVVIKNTGAKSIPSCIDNFSLETCEKQPEYWNLMAQNQLLLHLSKKHNTNVAKNVIIFIGDGMSIPTIAAARLYKGQLDGSAGEEGKLSFDDFPYTGLIKTYCVDAQVGDSACTSTSYLSGIKGNFETIGMPSTVTKRDCRTLSERENVTNIMTWAQVAGKHTGIVTTTRVTHASPAGAFAHIAYRYWESDTDILKEGHDPKVCPDAAYQLIEHSPGTNFKVILGGGRMKLLPNSVVDEDGKYGERLDGKNLIKTWLKLKKFKNQTAKYINNRESLLSTDPSIDNILGIFNNDHLKYRLDADADLQPTLEEMTRKAIEVLQKHQSGFVLFVEGGRIDQAHHDLLARKALDETLEFSKAVSAAVELTNESDTLIVVTADHAHTMSYSGYSPRGNDILGVNGQNGTDGLPYTTINYANGVRGDLLEGTRPVYSSEDLNNPNYAYPFLHPRDDEEAHGGDDVAVYARGPWSHLFVGSYEQNVIPHIMAYASCIGAGVTACNT